MARFFVARTKRNSTLAIYIVGECRVLRIGLTKAGYARINVNGVRVYAHRHFLEKKLGRPIQNGYEACHSCDTPNCIKEEHLFEGTHQENMKDAGTKGRVHGCTRKIRYSRASNSLQSNPRRER